ncbi:hypothetical protein [Pedobacter sp.]|uniref:hypothetical protein n=1 Tax=Pedobacter sp. TaxID=1411316 RepID=UPI003BAD9822
MEKLIDILKQQLSSYNITDIVQSGDREIDIVVETNADAQAIRKIAALMHDDSEVKIKGIKINYFNKDGARF